MALHKDDLMVVQKHDGANEIRKATIEQLSDFLQTSDTVVYKGTANFTINGEEPGTKSTGDLYINSALIDGTWAWSANSGSITAVKPGDRCIWNGTQWDLFTSGVDDSGVTEVTGSLPIEIENGESASPNVTVKDATDSTTGVVKLASAQDITDGSAGAVVTAAQLDDAIGNVTVPDATEDVKGIVELATDAEVGTGEAGKVVTAAQLKTTNDLISSSGGGTVTNVTGSDPIEVVSNTSTPVISIKDAAVSQKGAVEKYDATTAVGDPSGGSDGAGDSGYAGWVGTLDSTGYVTFKAIAEKFVWADFSGLEDA